MHCGGRERPRSVQRSFVGTLLCSLPAIGTAPGGTRGDPFSGAFKVLCSLPAVGRAPGGTRGDPRDTDIRDSAGSYQELGLGC